MKINNTEQPSESEFQSQRCTMCRASVGAHEDHHCSPESAARWNAESWALGVRMMHEAQGLADAIGFARREVPNLTAEQVADVITGSIDVEQMIAWFPSRMDGQS